MLETGGRPLVVLVSLPGGVDMCRWAKSSSEDCFKTFKGRIVCLYLLNLHLMKGLIDLVKMMKNQCWRRVLISSFRGGKMPAKPLDPEFSVGSVGGS
jgi:hypothetical protein